VSFKNVFEDIRLNYTSKQINRTM